MSTVAEAPEIAAPTSPLAEAESGLEDRAYLFSVQQYQRMVETGIITNHDRVVLLEGRLVTKMGKNPPHILANCLTFDLLRALAPAGWYVRKEDPIETLRSVPEPDVTVIRGTPRDYPDRTAGPNDVNLVVEVADSSLRADRSSMKRIYAGAAIPTYWIVNIPERCLEVFDEPSGPSDAPDYGRRQVFGVEELAPLVLDGREVGRVAVKDLLP